MQLMIVLILFLAAVFFFILYMYKEAFKCTVIEESFTFSTFPKSFGEVTLFFISDIHRRDVTDRLIGQVKGRADIVIIGGDLIEKGVSFEKVENNIKKLSQIGPVYFVWGNNDYEIDYHRLDSLLLSLNVKILDNKSACFESNEGEKFYLIGLDSVTNHRDNIRQALIDSEKSSFKILVCHDPKGLHKISEEDRVSLLLCGHTHGGQIRLGKLGIYDIGGIKQVKGITMLISNGYGTTSLPLRFGAKSQTHLIRIKNDDKF